MRTAALAALGLSMLLIGIANAAATDTATVTVQAGALSLSMTDDVAGLGSPGVGSIEDTTSGNTNNDLAYDNIGSADFSSVGINAVNTGGFECIFSPAATDWSLVESGTPSTDQFQLQAATDDNFVVDGNDPVILTENNNPIAMEGSAQTTGDPDVRVDLQIELGSGITTQGTSCTISLVLTATG